MRMKFILFTIAVLAQSNLFAPAPTMPSLSRESRNASPSRSTRFFDWLQSFFRREDVVKPVEFVSSSKPLSIPRTTNSVLKEKVNALAFNSSFQPPTSPKFTCLGCQNTFLKSPANWSARMPELCTNCRLEQAELIAQIEDEARREKTPRLTKEDRELVRRLKLQGKQAQSRKQLRTQEAFDRISLERAFRFDQEAIARKNIEKAFQQGLPQTQRTPTVRAESPKSIIRKSTTPNVGNKKRVRFADGVGTVPSVVANQGKTMNRTQLSAQTPKSSIQRKLPTPVNQPQQEGLMGWLENTASGWADRVHQTRERFNQEWGPKN